jgi:hypothetical protein
VGGRGGGGACRRNRRRWQVWGSAAAVTPYIGAAAAVPHDGRILPSWPTAGAALTVVAHGGRLPRAQLPAADRWQSLAPVGHGGFVANRRRARWPPWCTAVGC